MISCLHEIIPSIAAKHPSSTAIAEPQRSITYAELDRKIAVIAAYLKARSLKKRERVGIISSNSIDSIAVLFAISRIGGVAVPLNHSLEPSDIAIETNHCSTAALYFGRHMDLKAEEVIRRTKSIRFAIGDKDIDRMLFEEAAMRLFSKTRRSGLAVIMYTSGTTGRPLGVMLSHKNLISNNNSVAQYLHLTLRDKVCCVLQMHYIYGLSVILSHLLVGATVILDNRFVYPNLILDTIDKFKATIFAGVSSHYAIMLYASDMANRRLPSLRCFLQAGDKMPEETTRKLLSLFPRKKLYLMYGQTEASPRLTYLDPKLLRRKPASAGRAIPGVEVRIMNKSGRECDPGEEGEIIARGDNVMLGYWKNKRETNSVIKNGWLRTGDMAYKDKDGDIFIVGRKKDIIKIGGRKVNPREIEDLVVKYKGVMESAVVDFKDKLLGRKIKLFVAPICGKKLSAKDIMRFCRAHLPSYKVPLEIIILKHIPKNSFGKVDKFALRLM
jgi:acyl-CoA synthetase (AMP-forming)/AMP-acid ligase II